VALLVAIEQYVYRLLWRGTAFQQHQTHGTVTGVPEPEVPPVARTPPVWGQ
jgi:hypothetical protein